MEIINGIIKFIELLLKLDPYELFLILVKIIFCISIFLLGRYYLIKWKLRVEATRRFRQMSQKIKIEFIVHRSFFPTLSIFVVSTLFILALFRLDIPRILPLFILSP